MIKIFAAVFASFLIQNATAQDRPSEADLFGGAPTKSEPVKPATKASTKKPSPSPTPATVVEPSPLDDTGPQPDAFASGAVAENPMQIGGTLYQRLIFSGQQDVDSADFPLSLPTQFDLFLDSRPSDRIRGFIDERLLYDSSKDQYSRTTSGNSLNNVTSASTTPNNPQTVLDQAWLKFDIDHTVFVTAGKQHVKWGTSRFWNPTDFLSTQTRDPLLPYDLRLGNTMAKFEIPLEKQHTNLYAIGVFDNPQPASTLGQLGLALRAETVFGQTEVGADLIARGHRTPTYGLDISSALGPFDVYAEAALLTTAPGPVYKLTGTPSTGADVSTLYSSSTPDGMHVQASGGLNYTFAWKENRLATIGVEYFHNPLGYDDASVYPLLILLNQYKSFYVGKDYAALYVTAEGPDSQKNTSYTFSTLSNLSDKSLLSRLDFSWRTLTYLTFECYGDVHYGGQGGEFNFTLNTPAMTYSSTAIPAINLPRTVYDVGIGLRVAF